ncbi:hypothetical protein PAECIP111802_06713 [Paenibacillus allorhizosphaerae]|uniref:Uncharacterized protein n=1 Tax=Paenibacillus allorhizosphaerae TaxID=2849866 RepID=A0ABM8VT41_9BACL|nr:hypothetical protein PAECIP111802_06713 [Paenibacillus allorhizosphaerae]
MSLAIKILLSSIELSAMIVLSLSMFRFQFYYYLHKIYGIALLMSIISFYFRDINHVSNLTILPALTVEIILIMIVYRIPFFYSLLMCIPGFVAVSIIELALYGIGKQFLLFDESQVRESALLLGSVQVSATIIIIFLIYLLQRRKFGFLFKSKNLASKSALKGYNFILSAVLVLSLILIQLELISWYQNSVSYIITIVMVIIFLIGIFVAYRHNKQIIRDKYERPVKDELDRSFRNQNSKDNP